jgi:hypothetical protein
VAVSSIRNLRIRHIVVTRNLPNMDCCIHSCHNPWRVQALLLFFGLSVCVRACVRARVCVCVCVESWYQRQLCLLPSQDIIFPSFSILASAVKRYIWNIVPHTLAAHVNKLGFGVSLNCSDTSTIGSIILMVWSPIMFIRSRFVRCSRQLSTNVKL